MVDLPTRTGAACGTGGRSRVQAHELGPKRARPVSTGRRGAGQHEGQRNCDKDVGREARVHPSTIGQTASLATQQTGAMYAGQVPDWSSIPRAVAHRLTRSFALQGDRRQFTSTAVHVPTPAPICGNSACSILTASSAVSAVAMPIQIPSQYTLQSFMEAEAPCARALRWPLGPG